MKSWNVLRLAVLLIPACWGFAQQAPQLSIVVVEGEGAINNIKQRTSRETIVEVQDENHKPVAGAVVVFLLPNDGAGGAFAGGARSAMLTTDSAGRATMPTLQPNQVSGNFQIRVNASSGGRQANTSISQSNGVGAAGAGGASAGISGKTIAIIVGVAAAVGVGVAVGLKGKGNGGGSPPPPPPPVPTGTIGLGSGASVGPPQ